MALKRLNRIVQLSHTVSRTRPLHGSGCGLQLGAATQTEAPMESPRAVFRTSESEPASHGEQHIGQFYTIPPSQVKTIFPHGLPYRFQQQIKTFNEACLMVRKPALELIGYLKKADPAHPSVRYVLYGERGTGKSLSLCHALHHCSLQDWLILHVPDAHLWVKNCKELMSSSYHRARFDQPIEASVWLKNFRVTNERFLKQIKTSQKYVWSKREFTDEGRPLGEIVDQGVTRVKNASDAVGVVLKELKAQARPGSYRLVVGVDGVNALWGRTTLRKEDRSLIDPSELTLVHNLRKMMKNDWCGGAVIATVTQTGSVFTPSSAYLPQELLGKEGFDFLDPFLPVLVPAYSEKEFESSYQYYRDRRWIQHHTGTLHQVHCPQHTQVQTIFPSLPVQSTPVLLSFSELIH
ncbi:small ribosomal subunit protein mS29-like isoform X1 [Acipenser ruthenus]|uniref:small ribosomal subunit protein mS29-like isoform X1 n=1 Tax=Acipenser ruthenus TaxID=7906 RepID=UPI0027412E02|nr:small ribosomal subunit protein mS29-like isoform X1 [Acipenser ruthenus]XP_058876420.1 small ribosomal subunit protein mS29-like isoform X1 [Acipenser ruthenus]